MERFRMVCSLAAAALLWLQPDPAALIPLYRQALEQRIAQLGPNHPKVARAASDLGLYLHRTGDRDGALVYLRQALATDERALGPRHPLVAEDLENIALLLPASGALPLLIRAKECEDHATAARISGKLGGIYENAGDAGAARASYREALQRQEMASGPQHPQVAVRLNDLALSVQAAEAEPLLRRALAIQSEALGGSHPETATTLNNLASILLQTGRLDDAERTQRRAVSAMEQSLGSRHPRVAASLTNLGDILRIRGALNEAIPLYRRAVSIQQGAGLEIAEALDNLAGALEQAGQSKEAKDLRNRARSIRATAPGAATGRP